MAVGYEMLGREGGSRIRRWCSQRDIHFRESGARNESLPEEKHNLLFFAHAFLLPFAA